MKTFHVDIKHRDADDAGPGEASRPFKSLARALEEAVLCNRQNIETHVIVHPGVYREQILLQHSDTDAPMTIEASDKGKAIVSGSDIWDGWNVETSTWTRNWPFRWGLAPYPGGWEGAVLLRPIVRRREMVFLNGDLLKQTLEAHEMTDGCFTVSEADGVVRFRPSANARLERPVVEVAVRAGLFSVNGRRNITVRGLRFQHDNTPIQGAAVSFSGCRDALVENCEFVWNNWGGFAYGNCENITVRNCVAQYNGGTGMGGFRSKNALFDNNDASFNNWRGAAGDFVDWAAAGQKHLMIHGGVFRAQKCVSNKCRGFWFDFDCADVALENAYLCDNMLNGIFIEASQGPVAVKNSVICGNHSTGVISTNSSNVTLTGNTLYGNAGFQIEIAGAAERQVTDWETNRQFALKCENWTLSENVIVGVSETQNLVYLAAWDHLLDSLKLSRNMWYTPHVWRPFRIASMGLTCEEWQSGLGQDLDSVWGDPIFRDPVNRDFTPQPQSLLHSRSEWPRTQAKADGRALLLEKQKELIAENIGKPYPLAGRCKGNDWRRLDLKPFANRALSGEGKDDANAWIGQSLWALNPGVQRIHGVEFDVINQKKNFGKAAVALRSLSLEKAGVHSIPSEITIPVDCHARAVYFLHGAGYATTHEGIAEYHFMYEDGTTAELQIVSYGGGSEHIDVAQKLERESNIQDWWPAYPQFENENARHVIVASNRNPMEYTRYIYTLQWVNPQPEKKIEEICLASDPPKAGVVLVLAISVLLGHSI